MVTRSMAAARWMPRGRWPALRMQWPRSAQPRAGITSGWARLRIGARLPVDLPPAAWYARAEELTLSNSGAELERLGFALPAFQCEKNTPLVRAFLSGIRATGGAPSFVYKTGTADLNIV